MTSHFGQFNADAEAQFNELAAEKYDFGCGSGEKMVFGKCAKVGGGSDKKEVPASLTKSKATIEAQLASAKKRGSKNQIRKAEKALASVNKKIAAFNASEEEFAQSGCPDGFRSKGSQTISGKRREVCCTPDGKICMTADGIPL